MLKQLVNILIIFFLPIIASSQCLVQFMPEINGRNVDGLLNVRIISSSPQSFKGNLTIEVKEALVGTVVKVILSSFDIKAGLNSVPFLTVRGAILQFGTSSSASVVKQTGSFPKGNYQYCFELLDSKANVLLVETCFDQEILPFSDLLLTQPFEEEHICEERPLFVWQPLIPIQSKTQYSLVLTEVKGKQSPLDAINYNIPVFTQRSILVNTLMYPSNLPPLRKGKKYTWVVSAYMGEIELNRSEVWQFTVGCTDSINSDANDGYRSIENLMRGNFYIAHGIVKFSIYNAFADQNLKYIIVPLNRLNKIVSGQPKIKLKTGTNNINIDLSENNDLEDQHYYVLVLTMPNGERKQLRFQYKTVQ